MPLISLYQVVYIILILSVDVPEATDLMHNTNFIQVVSQGLVKLNWGML